MLIYLTFYLFLNLFYFYFIISAYVKCFRNGLASVQCYTNVFIIIIISPTQYCQSTQIPNGIDPGSPKFPCMSHTPPSVKACPHALRGKEAKEG